MPTPLIYLAGSYLDVEMEEIIDRIAEAGGYPVIPIVAPRTSEFWREGAAALIGRCDGVVFMPGWPDHPGARVERDACEHFRKPALNLWENAPKNIFRDFIDDCLTPKTFA